MTKQKFDKPRRLIKPEDGTIAYTWEGKLYMFGSNVNFKLGIESINLIEKYPKSVDSLVGVKKVR